MNQRDVADRFSSDVDHLLREAGLAEPGLASNEYEELLKLAQKLAAADFSRQSKIRYSLRRRLLNRIDSNLVDTAEIPGPWSLTKQLFTPGLAALVYHKFSLAALAGLIVVLALTWSYLPGLPVGQSLLDLAARVLVYLPFEGEGGPHELSLRWQFRGQGGISSPPAAANGLIYAGGNAGYLYALDDQTGREVWRFQTGAEVNLAPATGFGLVYAASEDGYLYALDSRTGQEKWRFQGVSRFTFGPLVAADTLLVGTEDGTLYALQADTAQEKWRFKAGNAILPTATVAGPTLYLGSQDHYLYALELETGREKWRFDAGNWLSTPPVEVAGLVYMGSHDEHIYVLDAQTGREQRRYSLGQAVRTSATAAGGMIYFGSYDSYLHAVDGASGEEQWRFKMGKQTRSTPVVTDGVVFIGSGDGYLYEIDARTGLELARYGIDSQIYTTPVVVGEAIYFVSGKDELYAVQRTPLALAAELVATEPAGAPPNESPGFQLTPAGWYVEGSDQVIRFRGRMVDGAGQPVNGFSVQADNGLHRILSAPSGPNRWQPQANPGEWEIVIPAAEREAGWWWLTAGRPTCAGEAGFEPACQEFTRLSESVKVEIVYPDETVINAGWTCQWACQSLEEK